MKYHFLDTHMDDQAIANSHSVDFPSSIQTQDDDFAPDHELIRLIEGISFTYIVENMK